MDNQSQHLLYSMAHNTHQKNRSEGADYIERWSAQPQRKFIFRWNFWRSVNKQQKQIEIVGNMTQPALHKVR